MSEEVKLREVIAGALGVDSGKITNDASPDTIDEWTSLKHMDLVLALESSFDIEFADEEIGEILNFELIKAILSEHGICF
jgi:acyl carrier protein